MCRRAHERQQGTGDRKEAGWPRTARQEGVGDGKTKRAAADPLGQGRWVEHPGIVDRIVTLPPAPPAPRANAITTYRRVGGRIVQGDCAKIVVDVAHATDQQYQCTRLTLIQ